MAHSFWGGPRLAVFLSLILLSAVASGQEKLEKVRLWEGDAPGALGQEEKDRPTVDVYPIKSDQPAPVIVVCPGGGYGGLAMGHEGVQIAEWLNRNGIVAVVLNYRHRGKGYGHPVPLQDVQRAIRMTRHHAADWSVDPDKLGVMGFSAGGHLASTAATHFDGGADDAQDPVDRQSCRPDFAILCYGVLTMGTDITHKGSEKNLLGDSPDQELVDSLSNEKQVTSLSPPTFLFHTDEDTVVLPENSVAFYMALRKHRVPAEMHIFQNGRHGVGLAAAIPGTSHWSDLCLAWLKNRKLLSDTQP